MIIQIALSYCFYFLATWSTRNESHNPKQTLDRFILNDQKRREVSANVVFIQVFRQLQRFKDTESPRIYEDHSAKRLFSVLDYTLSNLSQF